MHIKEIKTITKEIIVACKCDVCGKEVKDPDPDDWHSFSHSHSEWGNDSIDSYEYHHVCSAECYKTKMIECVKDLEELDNATVDGFHIQFARKLFNAL